VRLISQQRDCNFILDKQLLALFFSASLLNKLVAVVAAAPVVVAF
jgi:hypothetical protein